MQGRYELKYHITSQMYEVLRRRAGAVLHPDPLGDGGSYRVSSLYYDDVARSALREKLDGVPDRRKYRIRAYGGSDDVIRLECKRRLHEFVVKESLSLTRQQYVDILTGDTRFLMEASGVGRQFYIKLATRGLEPAVVVDYQRLAYIGPAGLRLTFDSRIRASLTRHDLFEDQPVWLNVDETSLVVMEVKFNHTLPAVVQTLLSGCNVQPESISKYAMCMQKIRRT